MRSQPTHDVKLNAQKSHRTWNFSHYTDPIRAADFLDLMMQFDDDDYRLQQQYYMYKTNANLKVMETVTFT